MEQGGLAETKGNQLQNFLKTGRGDARRRAAVRAGSGCGSRQPAAGLGTMSSAVLRRNSSKQGLQNLIR